MRLDDDDNEDFYRMCGAYNEGTLVDATLTLTTVDGTTITYSFPKSRYYATAEKKKTYFGYSFDKDYSQYIPEERIVQFSILTKEEYTARIDSPKED